MSAEVTIKAVPPGEVLGVWPEVEPLLAMAVEYCHGETDTENILTDLIWGGTKLLVIHKGDEMVAAVVLSIHQHPLKKICMISFAGGTDMESWSKQGLPVVEQIARDAGASSVYINGRRGWLRQFKKSGYSGYSTVIGKELER